MREDTTWLSLVAGNSRPKGRSFSRRGPGVGHVAVVGGGDAAGEVLGDKGLDVL